MDRDQLDMLFATCEAAGEDAVAHGELAAFVDRAIETVFPFAYALVGSWRSTLNWGEGDVLAINAHPRANPHFRYLPFVGYYSRGLDNGVIHDVRDIGDGCFAFRWSQIVHTRPLPTLRAGGGALWFARRDDEHQLLGLVFRSQAGTTKDGDKRISRWRLERMPPQ